MGDNNATIIKTADAEYQVFLETKKQYGDGFIARASKSYSSGWYVAFYNENNEIYDFDYDDGDYF